MRTTVLPVLLCLASCGAEMPDPIEHTTSAIIGGQAGGPDFVVALEAQAGLVHCSGALVAPSTVLTAAHCLSVEARTLSVVVAPTLDPGPRVTVVEAVLHPSEDLALVRLESAVMGVRFPTSSAPLRASDLGARVHVSGFGVSDLGSGARREVVNALIDVGTQLQLSAEGGQACSGDSGGPAWVASAEGPALVGVVSRGDVACRQGTFLARVDVAWLRRTMARWEGASCSLDAACAVGCVAPDPDCGCEADGVCSAACVAPGVDPDCDARCVGDGRCASGPCASPDPDCLADGAPCGSGAQCRLGRCLAPTPAATPVCAVPSTDDVPAPGAPVGSGCSTGTGAPLGLFVVWLISARRSRTRARRHHLHPHGVEEERRARHQGPRDGQ